LKAMNTYVVPAGPRYAPCPTHEARWPRKIEHTVAPCEDWGQSRIIVEGVTVSIIIDIRNIEVIVEGELPNDLAFRVAEEIRANAESTIRRRCVLESV